MKFSIEREELLRGLGRIQGIVERRGSLPVLSNVLMQATSEGVTLSATDLEVGVVGTYAAEVAEEGATTLAGRKLYEIVRELEESPIEIGTEEGSRIRVECGGARFSLLTIAPEEYPTIPSAEGTDLVSLDTALLGEMIDRTLYAASTDETRYNLNGIHLERSEEGRLCFVATDGHRLARVEKALPEPIPFLDRGILVPRKGMGEIRKLCEEGEGPLEIGLQETFLIVRRPDLVMSTRLIDGEFPNYRQVLPKEERIRIVLDRQRLTHAVRRVALVAHERSRGFKVVLNAGEIELSTSNPDLGEARETLPIEYQGDRFETAFNARYVLDALGAMFSKEVALGLVEELAPVRLQPADDPDQLAVIMPMRL
jgi:DNA polymerase-3 subunit beta